MTMNAPKRFAMLAALVFAGMIMLMTPAPAATLSARPCDCLVDVPPCQIGSQVPSGTLSCDGLGSADVCVDGNWASCYYNSNDFFCDDAANTGNCKDLMC